jgi:riboflavin kinase/FMN adenylyltransferase
MKAGFEIYGDNRTYKRKRAIALGFFDGVHIGHSRLLALTVRVASERGLSPAALTFDRHPVSVISGNPQPLLNTADDRRYIIGKYCGINDVIFARFDGDFMRVGWRDFIRHIVVGRYGAEYIIAGWDYRFGYKAEGTADFLAAEASALGIGCEIIPEVTLDGITVSSTFIRKLVADGNVERAARFLGHPHILSGVVEHGNGFGRTLGIPTINIKIPPEVQEPKRGVYASRVIWDSDRPSLPGVTNIGTKPTVTDSGEVLCETHIIGFDENLYGKLVRLELLKFIRPEIRFSNTDELRDNVLKDIETARSVAGI